METPIQQLGNLFRFLKKNRSDDLLMPIAEKTKQPIFAHKNGQWSWDKLKKTSRQTDTSFNVAILMKTLIALDFDDLTSALNWEELFPILKTAPMESTKQGRHYILGRTPLCDLLGLYDKADCFAEVATGKQIKKIDLKTLCKTGTSGVLVIAPSANKTWVRPLWNTTVPDMPKDMTESLAAMYQARKSTRSLIKRSVGRPPKRNDKSAHDETPTYLQDKKVQSACLVLTKAGFNEIKIVSITEDGFNFDAQRNCDGDRTTCPLCLTKHDNQHWWAIISGTSGFEKLTVKSYSGSCKARILLFDDGLTDFYELKFEDRFDRQEYTQRHVVPFDDSKHRVTVEAASYGLGKTTAAVNFCLQKAISLGIDTNDLRVVLVCTRQAFAINKATEFSSLGLNFSVYLDEIDANRDLRCVNQIAIEMESMWRLAGGVPPHVLLVDEAEAVADLLSSVTMLENNPRYSSEVFATLVKESKAVLWLDAAPLNRGTGCLHRILPASERVLYRKNKYVNIKRKAFEIRRKSVGESEADLIDLTIHLLQIGKRVVAPVGTKNFGDRLIDKALIEVPGLIDNYKYYHGEIEDSQKKDFREVNRIWSGLRLLMYTGLASVGISFERKNQFDVMIVQGSVYGPKPRDLVQMMHRVRDLKDDVVYYTLDTCLYGKRYETSWEGVKNDKKAMLTLQRAYIQDPDDIQKCPAWYAWTHLMNDWETRLSRQYFRCIFHKYIEATGYEKSSVGDISTLPIFKDETDEEAEILAYAGKLFIDQSLIKDLVSVRRAAYKDIPVPTSGEYQNMLCDVYASKATARQKDIVARYEFDNFIVQDHKCQNDTAYVFDTMRSNKAFKTILMNKYFEINSDPHNLFKRGIKASFSELSTKHGETLGLIKKLLMLVGLRSTHDVDNIIHYDIFLNKKNELQAVIDDLFRLMGIRDITSKTSGKQQPEVVRLAKTLSRILKEFGGIGLKSILRQKRVDKKKVSFYDYRLHLESCSNIDMEAAIRVLTPDIKS